MKLSERKTSKYQPMVEGAKLPDHDYKANLTDLTIRTHHMTARKEDLQEFIMDEEKGIGSSIRKRDEF